MGMKSLTYEELINDAKTALNALRDSEDPEVTHVQWEEILLELLRAAGFGVVVAVAEEVKGEVGFWYA